MNDQPEKLSEPEQADEPLTLSQFFETVPPNTRKVIPNAFKLVIISDAPKNYRYDVMLPEILIHCTHENCNGPRVFRADDAKLSMRAGTHYQFCEYLCSNCRTTTKIFSVRISTGSKDDLTKGVFTKLGEFPPFGPITPTRLLKLLGDERETFLRGRRCENQGLGIGAFSYYRRVVENQKDRIIDEIIKASETIGVGDQTINTLRHAKSENQFAKSVAMVKDAIPQALMIKGHNPLSLLHAALSDGLHARSDEECLEIAHDIRVVLAELSERLSQVLKDEAELNTAVSRLLRPRTPPTQSDQT